MDFLCSTCRWNNKPYQKPEEPKRSKWFGVSETDEWVYDYKLNLYENYSICRLNPKPEQVRDNYSCSHYKRKL